MSTQTEGDEEKTDPREPAPVVVIGVGKAGIDVIHKLDSSGGFGWGDAYDDYFKYIAIDSSANEVNNTPDKATPVYLQSPDQNLERDKEYYPYLKKSFDLSSKGAQRRRPIGRYKFDNRSTPSWDAHYTNIRDTIRDHLRRMENDPDVNSNQLHVIHVHSMGGGTGSGTFPIIARILDEITANLEQSRDTEIYTAGIGVVPEIIDNINVVNPPGDNKYYANANAALQDLKHLLEADSDNPLPFWVYSKIMEMNPNLERLDHEELDPTFEVERSPYRHYFLLGVDEDQISGTNTMAGPETYQEMVDNTIGTAIYGLAMYGSQIENWFQKADGEDQFGSFGQTELSIQIEDVRAYCRLDERVEELREQVDPPEDDREGTLIEKRRRKIADRNHLQSVLDDPGAVMKDREDSESLRGEVKQAIGRRIDSGENVHRTTTEDIDDIADTLRERYDDEEVIAFAMDETAEYIENQGEGIKTAWREIVTSKYKEWEVADQDGYGYNVQTTADKARDLERFLEETIAELEDSIAELEEQQTQEEEDDGGWFGILGGDDEDNQTDDELESYRSWRDTYETTKEKLEEMERKKEQVENLKQEAKSRRDRILEETIKPEVEGLQNEIDDLRREIEEKQEDLKAAIENRKEKIKELTDAEYGERLGYMALDEQKVREDLDRDTLEEDLTSLAAFEEEGYLQRDFADRAEARIQRAFAWESALLTWSKENSISDSTFGDSAETIRDIWMLHSEENSDLPDFDMIKAGDHEFRRSGKNDEFPSFEDPYTVQFVTYTLDSPLGDLKLYSDLKEAQEENWFNRIIDEWDDYRLSFAYPEWYGEDIQDAFDIESTEKLIKLPELDESKIDTEKEAGELKRWLSSRGIASYLWGADDWNQYEGFIGISDFDSDASGWEDLDGYRAEGPGWKHVLGEHELSYHDMRSLVPSGRRAKMWHAGDISWEDLLEDITEELKNKHNIKVELIEGEE